MKPATLLPGLLLLLLALLCAAVVGPDGLGLTLSSLGGDDDDGAWLALHLRLSRGALALAVGAALSAVGATLQALLRNPLADPFVLGVSGGAAMGAALATAVGTLVSSTLLGGAILSDVLFGGVVAGALVGAFAASAVLLVFLRRGQRGGIGDAPILVGVVVNAFAWAVVAVVRAVLPAQASAGLSIWLIGTLSYPTTLTLIATTTVVVIGLVFLTRSAGALAVMRAGDDDASRLGIDVDAVRRTVLFTTTALVGVAVATTGVIGFIGLLVPHAVRRLGRDDDRLVIPRSAFVGGAVLCVLDALARGAFGVVGAELPVGALCALLGAPVFAVVLWRSLSPDGLSPVGPSPVGPSPVGPSPVGPSPVGPSPEGRALS